MILTESQYKIQHPKQTSKKVYVSSTKTFTPIRTVAVALIVNIKSKQQIKQSFIKPTLIPKQKVI